MASSMQHSSRSTRLKYWLSRFSAKLLKATSPEESLKTASSKPAVPLRAAPPVEPRKATPSEPAETPQITPPGLPTTTLPAMENEDHWSSSDSKSQSIQKMSSEGWPTRPQRIAPFKLLTQEDRERISDNISTASAKVSSVASLGILNIAEAQAGAATTAAVARFVADSIPYLLDDFSRRAGEKRTNDPEEIAQYASTIPSWPKILYDDIGDQPAKTVASHVKGSLNGLHAKATVAAIIRAEKRLLRSIANVMEDHVLISGTTKWTLRILIFTVSAAASEAALMAACRITRTSAGDIALVDNDPPPPYMEDSKLTWERGVHGG
ncbi:uncharacterized protein F4817DRAFT_326660 [Daldinia loculata]|uniref:uncharacterized protein n=1 Tax=Daldinia loculata TaxID=103429 RepID=UPI0020C4152A|nr:uncharacterized protein F4817DRAFT_326660 [Daldinia loculata]KAI1651073.1 hypothetical protein F4817DRAFT_326660 [Daldinia loculata]